MTAPAHSGQGGCRRSSGRSHPRPRSGCSRSWRRARRAPAGCLGDRVDQQDQPARPGDRTEGVKPSARRGDPAVGDDPRCQKQRGRCDRDVEVEDVLPPGGAGEKAAGDQPNGRAACAKSAPDPERVVALGALSEHVHHDRQGGGQHDRGAQALNGSRCDQKRVAGRERASQRRRREHAQPCHQEPATPEQIRGMTAQQEKAAERERVRGHHPLQAGLGEVQVATDRRQRDIDDRQIDDRHEVRDRQQRKRAPAIDDWWLGRHRTCSGLAGKGQSGKEGEVRGSAPSPRRGAAVAGAVWRGYVAVLTPVAVGVGGSRN